MVTMQTAHRTLGGDILEDGYVRLMRESRIAEVA